MSILRVAMVGVPSGSELSECLSWLQPYAVAIVVVWSTRSHQSTAILPASFPQWSRGEFAWETQPAQQRTLESPSARDGAQASSPGRPQWVMNFKGRAKRPQWSPGEFAWETWPTGQR
jgi:hypothetical protein